MRITYNSQVLHEKWPLLPKSSSIDRRLKSSKWKRFATNGGANSCLFKNGANLRHGTHTKLYPIAKRSEQLACSKHIIMYLQVGSGDMAFVQQPLWNIFQHIPGGLRLQQIFCSSITAAGSLLCHILSSERLNLLPVQLRGPNTFSILRDLG